MASDHRGRDLHAGKRTNQEMASAADAYARQSGWNPGFPRLDHTKVYTKGQSPWGTAGLVADPKYADQEGNNPTWQVNAEGKVPPVTKPGEVVSTSADLGRGKKALGFEGSNALVVSGTTKTPKRAMIAAEAMKKRIDEGRDLKTGKPKK